MLVGPTADSTLLWKAAKLRYKLHSDQRMVYDKYQTWRHTIISDRKAGIAIAGSNPLVWTTDCSRRWGKDYLGLVIAFEDALKIKNAVLTYATSFLKDLGDIIIPLSNQLIEDCPQELKPAYRANYRGTSEGLYFANGSLIRFVGLDKNPDGLRGRHSDGVFISEAAYCTELDHALNVVLKPQLIGRYHATVMCNSTPPEALHYWDQELVPDAIDRGAYVKRTIDDCPIYTQAEKDLFTGGAEGRKTERIRREYYCERVRSATKVVLPEFDEKLHVKEFEIPPYAHGYTVIDPGVTDLCAANYAVWDFLNARLLVLDEFTERNANTNKIVDAVRTQERQLWSEHFGYWDGKKLSAQPYMRYSDVDLRMITDMRQLHGLQISPVAKDDAEAALAALRNAFLADKIWIHPRCKNTIEHCLGAVWNKGRTSFLRTERLGHADHVDALKYLWRSVAKTLNPYPPAGWVKAQTTSRDSIRVTNFHLSHPNSVIDKLGSLFPATWSRRR